MIIFGLNVIFNTLLKIIKTSINFSNSTLAEQICANMVTHANNNHVGNSNNNQCKFSR